MVPLNLMQLITPSLSPNKPSVALPTLPLPSGTPLDQFITLLQDDKVNEDYMQVTSSLPVYVASYPLNAVCLQRRVSEPERR